MQNHIDHIRQCLKIMRPMTAVEIEGAAAIEETLRKMEAELPKTEKAPYEFGGEFERWEGGE